MLKTEPWLSDPKATIAVLNRFNIHLKKKFGQNFLIDEHVIRKILEAAGVGPQDFILEIGPGIGTLTQHLAYNAGSVVAVEIDRSLIPIHEVTLEGYDNVEVINEDILKVDIAALAAEKNAGKPVKVVANLPYYITTPIIMDILESDAPIESMTFMVQKEVADRMIALPGTKDYGALSLAVQYYCEAEIAAKVPQNCFIPRPDVMSAVVKLTTRSERIPVKDPAKMFRLIKASFAQRRKTLVNCMRHSGEFDLGKEKLEELLASLGYPESIRGEKLSLEDFAKISDTF